jgi:Ca2+/Na+ antiporter
MPKPTPQKQPFILPAILSIIVAICTWFFIEYLDIAYGIEKYFSGSAFDMKQLQMAAGGSYYKSIKILVVLMIIVFVVYAVFYLLLFECMVLIYFFISSKWRRPQVFISYKNTDDADETDTTNIALTIKDALEQKGFTVLFFKYSKTMRHDVINNEIRNMLRSAHAMVVIPDPYHPSYVDTEIQCAAYAEKPVFIIKHTKDQQLPNTANSGHTVLLLDKLKKENYQPLIYLLQYVHKNWRTRLFIPGEPFLYFFETITNIIEGIKTYILALVAFVLTIVLLVYFAVPINIVLAVLKIVIMGIGIAAAFITLKKIIRNIHLQKIIRQSMLSSGKTYDHFKDAAFPENILTSLDKAGLKLKEDHLN